MAVHPVWLAVLLAILEIRKDDAAQGALLLFVGTRKRGVAQGRAGLFSGYLEHGGGRYNLHKLSDLLRVK